MKKIILIIIMLSSLVWADRFSRDFNGIVTDKVTSLQWQDDYSDNGGIVKMGIWEAAIDYCEALNLGGTGWRLPNMKELISIVDYTESNPSINSIFQYTIYGGYWSSTTSKLDDRLGYAQVVSFNYGSVNPQEYKGNLYTRTRCVRGGQ